MATNTTTTRKSPAKKAAPTVKRSAPAKKAATAPAPSESAQEVTQLSVLAKASAALDQAAQEAGSERSIALIGIAAGYTSISNAISSIPR